jgi:hypothetical protein
MSSTSGQSFEKTVQSIIESTGISSLDYLDANDYKSLSNVLVKRVPFHSIYKKKSKTEFVLCTKGRKIRIECKFQATRGTADEKFTYAYLNAIESQPEEEIIFVIDGNGYTPEALEWIKYSTRENLYVKPNVKKSMRVFNTFEFTNWALNGYQHLSTI